MLIYHYTTTDQFAKAREANLELDNFLKWGSHAWLKYLQTGSSLVGPR